MKNITKYILAAAAAFSSLTACQEFEDFDKAGSVKLVGLPSKTLAKNYLLAIRALRYAANFDLPVNPHTWVSIIQSANRILDYVPAREIMEEWRKVAAESMWNRRLVLH